MVEILPDFVMAVRRGVRAVSVQVVDFEGGAAVRELDAQALDNRLAELEEPGQGEDLPAGLQDGRRDLPHGRDAEGGDEETQRADQARPERHGRRGPHVAGHRPEFCQLAVHCVRISSGRPAAHTWQSVRNCPKSQGLQVRR